jgi:DNA-binding transcriptional regulator GbsR (MarR family)
MKLHEAKNTFIQSWGTFGSQWGINRTMSQIQALLMITDDALSTEDIMEALNISRGNVNMNIRLLIEWGIIYKEYKSGERREFYRAEKDIWTVAKRIMVVKKQRELTPLIQLLNEINNTPIEDGDKKQVEFFKKQVESMKSITDQADKTITKITNADENWFWKTFLRLIS